jgi:AmmeMemoRadiSam system protein B
VRAPFRYSWPPLFALSAGLAIALAVAFPGGEGDQPAGAATAEPSHPVAFYDERTFLDAVGQAEASPVEPMPGVRAVIVPHHWVGGYLILRGLRDLAASGDFTRVILVGPDHVGAGSSPVSTSTFAWSTPYGQLEPDTATINELIRQGLVKPDPDVLGHEHSVAGIVHAIKYYIPAARVVPLVMRHDMTYSEVRDLAAALAALIDDHTAVVAAVDFSHYLSAPDAEANDRETLAALEDFDSQAIMRFGDDHLDSPPSIAFTIELSRLVGAKRFVLRENTNSGTLTGTLSPPVTSYIAGDFTTQ